ncbi:TraX family protein [Erwiniaceae bacterium BAC15a-03b]|uniref:TraX family protein n=1 Tax=Winslowiella arboricola TaxID=2978220 RepID=A0A9J6PTT3_9GAMM|nr:TraX family protein [Winslowiella arboricola]MCU5774405.1 TraX family protein [Winslowiella arboricola]MCU5778952.1 TraX family protein [Winslowiella arboricola]
MLAEEIKKSQGLISLINNLSPLQTDLVKVYAFLAMVADHINIIYLHSHSSELYAIGRLAFPVFVILWARHTASALGDLRQLTRRLWLWALFSQPLFWLAFAESGQSWLALNIFFVFAGCTQALSWTYQKGTSGALFWSDTVTHPCLASGSRQLWPDRTVFCESDAGDFLLCRATAICPHLHNQWPVNRLILRLYRYACINGADNPLHHYSYAAASRDRGVYGAFFQRGK